jgi:hypothetical protein
LFLEKKKIKGKQMEIQSERTDLNNISSIMTSFMAAATAKQIIKSDSKLRYSKDIIKIHSISAKCDIKLFRYLVSYAYHIYTDALNKKTQYDKLSSDVIKYCNCLEVNDIIKIITFIHANRNNIDLIIYLNNIGNKNEN